MTSSNKPAAAPLTNLVQAAVGSIASARADLGRRLDELSDKHAELGHQRYGLSDAAISFDDYCQLLRQEIERLGEQYAQNLSGHDSGAHPDMELTWTDLKDGMVPEFTLLLGAPLSMEALCFLFPEVIYQRFQAALEKYGAAWPSSCEVPYAERGELIVALDRQRSDLMKQRSELVRQEEVLVKALATR